MSISVTALTLDSLDQLPTHARRCVFWELDPAVAAESEGFTDPVFEKEAWLSTVLLEWGSCGQIVTVDGRPAGCAIYSPPGSVPRAGLFPTSPVSADAVLLTALSLDPTGDDDVTDGTDVEGLASSLVQAVVADLIRRGVRALEAFGIRRTADDVAGDDTPRATATLKCTPTACMIDADFLVSVGFEVIAPHHRFPRLRLELDSDHGWKEDVEHALEQLLAAAALTMVELDDRAELPVR